MARNVSVTAVVFIVALASTSIARSAEPLHFEKRVLSERFFSEGADAGDIDQDGHDDVVSGPFWYRGPEFKVRVRYRAGDDFAIASYSDQFFTFVDDIDRDGDMDILVGPFPGQAGYWYENPGRDTSNTWAKHLMLDKVDGESPAWLDVDLDGFGELVCIHGGCLGFAEPREDPRQPWSFVRISPNRNYGKFTHGLGIGDIDGDGRVDFLETNGWWQQPSNYTKGDLFKFHPVRFASSGGAQMFAVDIDLDGDNDVVSSQNAHGFGLGWYEQSIQDGKRTFKYHQVMGDDPKDGLAVSQLHAVAVVDVDRDGRLDIVTGKRYWAHGGHDPDAKNDPVLYWFQNREINGRPVFAPHMIDERIGVGTQLVVKDIDGDDRVDIVVGNKLGTFALLQRRGTATAPDRPGVAPGSAAFATPIRPTEPLSPTDEQRTFRLPPGFEVQLVAAEPDIAKPLNLAFDVRGRLWVTVSLEYPYPAPPDRPGRDSIKVLEDTDGNGSFDKITTFADELNVPMGLYPYGDGVICFSIPHIWYLRDTDGDGKADRREEIYGPMGYERDTHGLCNSFRRGYDGWLYACHGFNNHTTVKGRDGHEISMQSGNTFRMRVDGQRIEQFTWGQVNPFGMLIDDRGDILTADCHTKPVTLLLQGGYFESFGKPHDGLGFVPAVMNHLHGSTAIAGITRIDPSVSPAGYSNTTLGGNVMTGCINRNTLVYRGSTIVAREEPDFLVSGDPWFRPVDVRVGPDGAIYVADFYNRIIGHYEVPLDHPGRDRHRGRIWRISYRKNEATPKSLSTARVDRLSISQLFTALETANNLKQQLIINHLCDRHAGDETTKLSRQILSARDAHDPVRVGSLWVLARSKQLNLGDLNSAYDHGSPLVRGHVMHVLRMFAAELGKEAVQLIVRGLRDADPLVRRYASQAAAQNPGPFFDELIPLVATGNDPHLRHAAKMALRESIRDEDQFRSIVKKELNPQQRNGLLAITLALDHGAAADFIVDSLSASMAGWSALETQAYIRHAAVRASPQQLDVLAGVIQDKMNLQQQRELLLVIRDGFAKKNTEVRPVIERWAEALCRRLLSRSESGGKSLNWSYEPIPGRQDQGNPFVRQVRKSADNRQGDFFSTLPSGERRVGIYRSAPFTVGDELTFFAAGHIGHPNEPVEAKNFIRLRGADNHQILREATPPRNDTAQIVRWETKQFNGPVYVEIVDGDSRTAFAWLAVGRFSEARLNPSNMIQDRQHAAQLFGAFTLSMLRSEFVTILKSDGGDPLSDREIMVALGAIAGSSRISACGEALTLSARNAAFRKLIVDAALSDDAAMDKALETAMLSATAVNQIRLAKRLVMDDIGCELLFGMITKGKASTSMLLDPAISERLKVAGNGKWKEQVEAAARSVQAEGVLKVQEQIDSRLRALLKSAGNAMKGAEVFKKRCSQCHQAAGVGAKFAPQLDGIASRGVARMTEDIVAPNRNVDVAFRTTTVLTFDGQVINGIIRSEDKERLVLVDQEGKERIIAAADVDEKVASTSSLMPANLGDQVNNDEWRDLVAFLLSLR